MRLLIVTFLILFSTLTIGQKCETYNNRTINCIDTDSLKQGFWSEHFTTKILRTDPLRRNSSAIRLNNDEGIVYIPIAEDFFKDNKRVGEWIFYKGTFYQDSYANPTSHEQKVIFIDSGYFRIIDTFWNFYAVVTNDTNKLEGKLYLKKDTVIITCKDKICYLKDPFKNNRKQSFPLKELDDKLIWYNFRSYKVREKKNGS